MGKFIDLHTHSRYSDGTREPSELVAMAAQKDLSAIAIADHDSVSGVDEALAAGIVQGVEVVPAVELSVSFQHHRDIHVLGYFINHADADFQQKLALFRSSRDSRARAIVDKINSKIRNEGRGESVGYDEVLSIASGAVSRLHIGRVLVSKGIARNIPDAFKRYLVPCDVPKRYFAMEDAIAEIRRVNGVSVLAHPPSIKAERHVVRQLIAQWQEMGLDGIEVFNKLCYKDDMIFYRSLATELKLLTSGGSDYHGYEDDVEMGTGSGGLEIPYSVLENLRSRISAQPTDVGSRP